MAYSTLSLKSFSVSRVMSNTEVNFSVSLNNFSSSVCFFGEEGFDEGLDKGLE